MSEMARTILIATTRSSGVSWLCCAAIVPLAGSVIVFVVRCQLASPAALLSCHHLVMNDAWSDVATFQEWRAWKGLGVQQWGLRLLRFSTHVVTSSQGGTL
mmetsp:Transcript_10790/g.12836  ORF Transcript_10790/g.12836 Transcript_10790/m.12836 type:complete len:101 (+) Transcript_10790:128-430(+)